MAAIPVYSQRFLDGQALDSSSSPLIYACPEGSVAVVKWISMTVGISIADCQASVRGASGGRLAYATNNPTSDPLGRTTAYQLSYAFTFGEAIAFTVDTGGTWDVAASGYLLSLP